MLRSIDEVAKQRGRIDTDDGIFDDSSVGSAEDGLSEEDEVLFDKGQPVEVLDSTSSRWEGATVEKVHSDGTYKVSINADGRRLTHMPAQSLRAPAKNSSKKSRNKPSSPKRPPRAAPRNRGRGRADANDNYEDGGGGSGGDFRKGEGVEVRDEMGMWRDGIVLRACSNGDYEVCHGAMALGADSERVAAGAVRERAPAYLHLDVQLLGLDVGGDRGAGSFTITGRVVCYWQWSGLASLQSRAEADGRQGVMGMGPGIRLVPDPAEGPETGAMQLELEDLPGSGGGTSAGQDRAHQVQQQLEALGLVLPLSNGAGVPLFANSVPGGELIGAESGGCALGDMSRAHVLRYYDGGGGGGDDDGDDDGTTARSRTGIVSQALFFRATLGARLDLASFPFDQQLLPIEINMAPRFGKPLRPQPFMTLCALARRAQRGRGGERLANVAQPCRAVMRVIANRGVDGLCPTMDRPLVDVSSHRLRPRFVLRVSRDGWFCGAMQTRVLPAFSATLASYAAWFVRAEAATAEHGVGVGAAEALSARVTLMALALLSILVLCGAPAEGDLPQRGTLLGAYMTGCLGAVVINGLTMTIASFVGGSAFNERIVGIVLLSCFAAFHMFIAGLVSSAARRAQRKQEVQPGHPEVVAMRRVHEEAVAAKPGVELLRIEGRGKSRTWGWEVYGAETKAAKGGKGAKGVKKDGSRRV